MAGMCRGYLPGIYSPSLAAPGFPLGEWPLSQGAVGGVNQRLASKGAEVTWSFFSKPQDSKGACASSVRCCLLSLWVWSQGHTLEHGGWAEFISGTLPCHKTLLGFLLLALPELPQCLPLPRADCPAFHQFNEPLIILLPACVCIWYGLKLFLSPFWTRT